MSWKIFSVIFFIVVVALLAFYWIIPIGRVVNFGYLGNSGDGNSNFTLENGMVGIQFYENMRYQSSSISYKIDGCPIGKMDEMARAFKTIEDLTTLNFYEAADLGEEEISVTCDSSMKVEGRTFIAGEGGVTNVTATDNFNVIFNGKVLLLRESQCGNPIVGTHELLHALGFDHSINQNNIMYPTINCGQIVGEDMVSYINLLYSFPSLPDLSLEDASASTRGNYLDISLTLKNEGLVDSGEARLIVYADGKNVKEFDVIPVTVGAGRILTLTNIFLLRGSVDEVKLSLDYASNELNKDNNIIVLSAN